MDEDYGEFLEILEEDDPMMTTSERASAGTPRWMLLLLAFAVVVLVLAIALVVYTKG